MRLSLIAPALTSLLAILPAVSFLQAQAAGVGEAPPVTPTIAQDTTAPPAQPAAGEPVVISGDTLFLIQSSLGPYSASERAGAVRQRLERLIDDPLLRFEEIVFAEGELSTDLLVSDQVVTSITNADAAAAGISREALATVRAAAIQEVLLERGVTARLRTILIGIVLSLLVAVTTAFVFGSPGGCSERPYR